MTEKNERLKKIIGETVGHASMCWIPKPSGVFDSEEASKVVDNCVEELKNFNQELVPLDKRVLYLLIEEAWQDCKDDGATNYSPDEEVINYIYDYIYRYFGKPKTMTVEEIEGVMAKENTVYNIVSPAISRMAEAIHKAMKDKEIV